MPSRKPSRVVPGTSSSIQKTAVQRQIEQQEAVTAFWQEATKLIVELRRMAHDLVEDARQRGRSQ